MAQSSAIVSATRASGLRAGAASTGAGGTGGAAAGAGSSSAGAGSSATGVGFADGTKPVPGPSPTKNGSSSAGGAGGAGGAGASGGGAGATTGGMEPAGVAPTRLAGSTSTHGSNRHWMHTLSGSCGGPSHSTSPTPIGAWPSTRVAFTNSPRGAWVS